MNNKEEQLSAITNEEIKEMAEEYIKQPHYDDLGHRGSFIKGGKQVRDKLVSAPLNIKTGVEQTIDGWATWFTVGVQTIICCDKETKELAEWYEQQVRTVLINISVSAPLVKFKKPDEKDFVEGYKNEFGDVCDHFHKEEFDEAMRQYNKQFVSAPLIDEGKNDQDFGNNYLAMHTFFNRTGKGRN